MAKLSARAPLLYIQVEGKICKLYIQLDRKTDKFLCRLIHKNTLAQNMLSVNAVLYLVNVWHDLIAEQSNMSNQRQAYLRTWCIMILYFDFLFLKKWAVQFCYSLTISAIILGVPVSDIDNFSQSVEKVLRRFGTPAPKISVASHALYSSYGKLNFYKMSEYLINSKVYKWTIQM